MAYQSFFQVRSQATDLSLRISSSWLHEKFVKKIFNVMKRIKWPRHATHLFIKLVNELEKSPHPGRRQNDCGQRRLGKCQRLIYATQHPVCMCAHACICVCECVCICMFLCLSVYVCVCVCVCTGTREYVCVASINLEAEYSKFIVVVQHYWQT